MNKKKELIKKINELSGSRSPYEVYCDWVKCMALALQNSCCMFQDETWAKREEEYIKTIRVYGEDGKQFAEMAGMLVMTLEDEFSDVLGEIYMESGCGNKKHRTVLHTVSCFPGNCKNLTGRSRWEEPDPAQRTKLRRRRNDYSGCEGIKR